MYRWQLHVFATCAVSVASVATLTRGANTHVQPIVDVGQPALTLSSRCTSKEGVCSAVLGSVLEIEYTLAAAGAESLPPALL